MKTTKYILFFFALLFIVGGLCLGFNTDMVLSRCFADGRFSETHRYYASQWMGPFIGLGIFNFLIARTNVRKMFRIAIASNIIAYIFMAGNFWRGYINEWIPYERQCLLEEITFQVMFFSIFIFLIFWEWNHSRKSKI